MDYTAIYLNLMLSRKSRELDKNTYYEKHHIYPKCLFPDIKNNKNNLVYLTAREHFIAHRLLLKMAVTSNEKEKLGFSMQAMSMINSSSNVRKYKITSRAFESIRKANKEALKLRKFSEDHKRKISESTKGRVVSQATRDLISKSNKGKIPPNKGISPSKETKEKISKSLKGRKVSKEALENRKGKLDGLKNGKAKKANLYEYATKTIIEENVCISEWCKKNPEYQQSKLSLTANGKRNHHKGIYAKYI
jgi:hypothetical protein